MYQNDKTAAYSGKIATTRLTTLYLQQSIFNTVFKFFTLGLMTANN